MRKLVNLEAKHTAEKVGQIWLIWSPGGEHIATFRSLTSAKIWLHFHLIEEN